MPVLARFAMFVITRWKDTADDFLATRGSNPLVFVPSATSAHDRPHRYCETAFATFVRNLLRGVFTKPPVFTTFVMFAMARGKDATSFLQALRYRQFSQRLYATSFLWVLRTPASVRDVSNVRNSGLDGR